MTIRRLEEDQCIEHRQVMARITRHTLQLHSLLEKVLRAAGLAIPSSDLYNVTPGSMLLQSESFLNLVLRTELNAGVDASPGSCTLSPRRGGSPGNLSTSPVSAYDATGQSLFATDASQSIGTDGGCSPELSSFGEFLGVRFPSLKSAVAAMDLTGTGRIACFELESWLRQQMYPGDARMLLKDLGRKGSLGISSFRMLAPFFIRGSTSVGRPGGPQSAVVLRATWNAVDRKLRRLQAAESYAAVLRCTRVVIGFLQPDLIYGHEAEELTQWPKMDLTPSPLSKRG